MFHILNMVPPLHRLRLTHRIASMLFLQILFLALDSVMMQRPPFPRDRLAERAIRDVSLFTNSDGIVLQEEVMRGVRFAVVFGLDEGFDVSVVLGIVVNDAGGESFAASLRRTLEETGGSVSFPVGSNGANPFIVLERLEEFHQSLIAGHFEVLIRIEVSDPGMLGAEPGIALVVDVFLHDAVMLARIEVLEGKNGVRHPVGLDRKRRLGAIVHDIKATDAEMMVVMLKELGECV